MVETANSKDKPGKEVTEEMDKKKGGRALKKGKRGKKGKKKPANDVSAQVAAQNDKKELIAMLMSKTEKTEEEVLEAYDKFHLEHPFGEISQEEFLKQSKVRKMVDLQKTDLFWSPPPCSCVING